MMGLEGGRPLVSKMQFDKVQGLIQKGIDEGATLVIPVLEEVLVVQKRVRLKEEIRITAHARSEPVSSTVVLRTEQAAVERFDDHVNEHLNEHDAEDSDRHVDAANPVQRDGRPETPHWLRCG